MRNIVAATFLLSRRIVEYSDLFILRYIDTSSNFEHDDDDQNHGGERSNDDADH